MTVTEIIERTYNEGKESKYNIYATGVDTKDVYLQGDNKNISL